MDPRRHPTTTTTSSKTTNLIYHRVYTAPPPRSELAPSQLTDDGLPVLILPPAAAPAAVVKKHSTTTSTSSTTTKLRKRAPRAPRARKQEEETASLLLDGPSSPISRIPPSFPPPPPPPPPPPKKKKKLRLVCISDTHLHTPYLPRGDILIHAGDLTNLGTRSELCHSISWLQQQPHTHKLVIAGNHEATLDSRHAAYSAENLALLAEAKGLVFLNHSAATVAGLSVFGSPFSPGGGDGRCGGFQYTDGEEPWVDVPIGTQLLVTHTPPRFHLDRAPAVLPPEPHRGCEALRRRVAKVRPWVHVFGHVHAGRGVEKVRWCGEEEEGWVEAREEDTVVIEDPNPLAPRRMFLVDARVQRGRETLCVNAAVARGSWKSGGGGREGGWGKAVVVDVEVDEGVGG